MESGRELDILIAEKVMGLKPKIVCGLLGIKRYILEDENNNWEIGLVESNLPMYSTNIEAAWKVVDLFDEKGGAITYSSMKNGTRGHFVTLSYLKNLFSSGMDYVMVEGESAPHTICLAALKTLEK